MSRLVWALLAAGLAPEPPAIVSLEPQPPVPAYMQEASVRRLRAVKCNTSLFDEQAARRFQSHKGKNSAATTFHLFAGTALRARWRKVEGSPDGQGWTWTGSVDGARYGHAVLISNGSQITANLSRGDGLLYQIRTAADGVIWVREIDQSRLSKKDQ
ncbi:MAG: hypothetical protein HY235_28075 [Acidobacteria bacterium]|nr:hypothetical protein [Acidobacteriota bacterium]